jgi:hypothetical protein
MTGETVSAATIMNAPAEAIVAVLADPARPAAIDGTGWVRESVDGTPLTAAGRFSGWPWTRPATRTGAARWPPASRNPARRAIGRLGGRRAHLRA